MKNLPADVARKEHNILNDCIEVHHCLWIALYVSFLSQAMVTKADNLLVKTVKPKNIKTAQAMVAFDPSNLQTGKMASSAAMRECIPLVAAAEWDRYITLPAQQPALSSTTRHMGWAGSRSCFQWHVPVPTGRINWWKSRLADFPTLAPVAIAYLLTPSSSAQAERSFSLLGHKRGSACVNVCLPLGFNAIKSTSQIHPNFRQAEHDRCDT